MDEYNTEHRASQFWDCFSVGVLILEVLIGTEFTATIDDQLKIEQLLTVALATLILR